ncbi:MAG: NUDIX domain-containing protein [Candidatus Acidiferrales bacterium]
MPGGGMDAGETAEETAVREAREECGLVLKICPAQVGGLVLKAVDIVYSDEEHQYFEKHSTFVAAQVVGNLVPTEKDHELMWVSLEEATRKLSPPSHRWAIERLIEKAEPVRE